MSSEIKIKNKIKLIALDLDGTTLNDDNTLAPRVKSAIEAACKNGIIVAAASGRPLSMMPECVTALEGVDCLITSNGAAIHRKGKCIDRKLLDPNDVLEILAATRGKDVILEGFINGFTYADVRYVHRPQDYGCSPAYFGYTRSCHGKVADMPLFLSRHRHELDLVSVVCTDKALQNEIRREVLRCTKSVAATSSAENFLEFMSADVSKAYALERLCKFLHIDMHNVCACGNADNDAEMIAAAGLGAAVENASQSCLDAADIILPSNNRGGVAALIEKILSRDTL